MTITHKVTLLAATIGLCLAAAAPADAATAGRTFYQNGGSACTGALPTYEGALRKRPKAIANEGTSAAFVTCSAPGNDANSENPSQVFAGMTNRSAAAVTVNCTFINGDEFFGSVAFPGSLELGAGGFNVINWTAEGGTFEQTIASISCTLPPGVEIDYFGQVINEDIGA